MKKITKKQYLIDLCLSVKNDIYTKRILGAIMVIAVVLLWIFFGFEVSLFLFILLAFALYEWDSRIIGVAALVLLAMCPFLLTYNRDSLSELVAMYAYVLLDMTLILQIIEYSRRPRMFKKTHEEK